MIQKKQKKKQRQENNKQNRTNPNLSLPKSEYFPSFSKTWKNKIYCYNYAARGNCDNTPTIPSESIIPTKKYKHAQYGWIVIFIPALFYFIYTINVDRKEVSSILRLSHSYNVLSHVIHVPMSLYHAKDATSSAFELEKKIRKIDRILYISKGYTDDYNKQVNYYNSRNQTLLLPLLHPVVSVMNSTIDLISYQFTDITWVHDDELGRGYLLISDQYQNGNIWRWEVGGGPLKIGKSLAIRGSGCRSSCFQVCHVENYNIGSDSSTHSTNLGSTSITIQTAYKAKNWYMGRLIIAELGEGQIIRMEEDGTRTSLVTTVPSPCNYEYHRQDSNKTRIVRLEHVDSMLYTPFGDLLFIDRRRCYNYKEHNNKNESNGVVVSSLYRLRGGILQSSISTVTRKERICSSSRTDIYQEEQEGRKTEEGALPDLLYHDAMMDITGLTLGTDFTTLYISASMDDNANLRRKYVILQMSLEEEEHKNVVKDDNDVEDTLENDDDEILKDFFTKPSNLQFFHDMTSYFDQQYYGESFKMTKTGPAITIDSVGCLYSTIPGGIIILDPYGKEVLTTIPIFDVFTTNTTNQKATMSTTLPSSILIGNDGYLYMTTKSSLLRVKVKASPLEFPTSFVVPPK